MNETNDGFISGVNTQPPIQAQEEGFDKAAWASGKQKEREQVFALIDETAKMVVEDEVAFKQYLDIISRFDKYSTGNTLLIMAQKPGAIKLADSSYWIENKAMIKKGEKAINLLEPGNEYQREDGTSASSFHVKKLFDISQTTSPKKADPIFKYDEKLILKAMLKSATVSTNISENLRDNIGASYDHRSKKILVRQGMDGVSIIRSVSQEMAHAYIASTLPLEAAYNRLANSFSAHAVSYIICKRCSIPTNGYIFSKIKEISKNLDSQQIREEFSKIRTVSNEIWNGMRGTLNNAIKNENPTMQKQAR